MKEKMPSLLGSKQGLEVACSLFNVLDAKDRKTVVKSLQEPLNEMSLNRVAHLFIIHILNNLDDTVVSKKKIIHDLMLKIDDNITDKNYQNIFIGVFAPKSKRIFDAEEIAAFEALQEHSTSKKDADTRRLELLKAICGPLEKFFEEGMAFYLQDINKTPLLAKMMAMRIELGDVKDSDCLDEMFRQIGKKANYGEQNKAQILMGHHDLHRVLKDLVKLEVELKQKEPSRKLDFCAGIARVVKANLDACLDTRAVFIVLELLKHEETAKLVKKDLQDKKKELQSMYKTKLKADGKQATEGLRIIIEEKL